MSRVIQTRITAPMKATMIDPMIAAALPDSQQPEEPSAEDATQDSEDDIDEDAISARPS